MPKCSLLGVSLLLTTYTRLAAGVASRHTEDAAKAAQGLRTSRPQPRLGRNCKADSRRREIVDEVLGLADSCQSWRLLARAVIAVRGPLSRQLSLSTQSAVQRAAVDGSRLSYDAKREIVDALSDEVGWAALEKLIRSGGPSASASSPAHMD